MICGTRGSPLAIAQTRQVLEALNMDVDIEVIRTSGDIYRGQFGKDGATKGLFTKEIDRALERGDIDFAVHSLKDVQVDYQFHIVVPKRGPHCDMLVTRHRSLDDLPEKATVGTGSPRRKTELMRLRHDLEIVPLRGNIGTRIDKASELDAVVVAAAGVERLGLMGAGGYNFTTLPAPAFMPAPCQGTLGIACRRSDIETRKVIERLRDAETTVCTLAEQEVMRAIGGNCHIPAGAWATVHGDTIRVFASINDPGTGVSYRDYAQGPVGRARDIAHNLADWLLERGADKIVRSFQ